jgi:hypothetical protein
MQHCYLQQIENTVAYDLITSCTGNPRNILSGLRIPMCNFLRVLGLLFYEGCHHRFRDHKKDNPLPRHGWLKRFEFGNFELETFPDVCITFNADGMAMDISDLKTD